jgi:lysine 2,3-aminomutase
MISQSPDKVVLRNFEGYMTSYTEALDYDPEAIKAWENKVQKRAEPGQKGVLALLEGDELAIKPQGFDSTHKRDAEAHRLNQDTSKWEPHQANGGNGKKVPLVESKD